MQLHVLAIGIGNADEWQANARRSIEQTDVGREDDPSGRWLADHRTKFQRAITFREILGIGQRMHVRDEYGRLLECALAKDGATGHGAKSARRKLQVSAASEHVDRVRIHEAAVV